MIYFVINGLPLGALWRCEPEMRGMGEKLCVTLLCHFYDFFFSEVEIALGSEFNA